MPNEDAVNVRVGKSWKLICDHAIYSCPATAQYAFVDGATKLRLLKSRLDRSSVIRKVEQVWQINPKTKAGLKTVTSKWQQRVEDYISDGLAIPEVLDHDGVYRFYALEETDLTNELSLPDQARLPLWLQSMSSSTDLSTQAALALWIEKDRFFRWPKRSELLWQGVTRDPDGHKQDCYSYPKDVLVRLTKAGLPVDGRNNGPAIVAYLLAGGERPKVGTWGWPIHHIYDGTEPPRPSKKTVPHAVRDGRYFTHSGGLVAAHPVAHHLAHQSALLKWLLRREAFLRFQFDPMNVFVDT